MVRPATQRLRVRVESLIEEPGSGKTSIAFGYGVCVREIRMRLQQTSR